MQDLALGPVELHAVCTVLSCLSRSLWMQSLTSSMWLPHTAWCHQQTTETALNPTVHISNKNVKQCQSQHQTPETPLIFWSFVISLRQYRHGRCPKCLKKNQPPLTRKINWVFRDLFSFLTFCSLSYEATELMDTSEINWVKSPLRWD